MAQAELVVGDGGSKLRVTVKDSVTAELIDLAGKAVKLRYKLNGGALVEKDMTPLDQINFKGQAEYAFATADLSAAGTLEGEVRLNDGLSDQLTSIATFHIPIRAALS